jgi:hypothetical protein
VALAVAAGEVIVPAVPLIPVANPAAMVSVMVTVFVIPETTLVTFRVVVLEKVDTGCAVRGEPAVLATDPEADID